MIKGAVKAQRTQNIRYASDLMRVDVQRKVEQDGEQAEKACLFQKVRRIRPAGLRQKVSCCKKKNGTATRASTRVSQKSPSAVKEVSGEVWMAQTSREAVMRNQSIAGLFGLMRFPPAPSQENRRRCRRIPHREGPAAVSRRPACRQCGKCERSLRWKGTGWRPA